METRVTAKVFFAYPSRPTALAEAIEAGISLINQTQFVNASSWKELAVSGHLVIREVCAEIEDSDILACELSTLNPNVLFELGYAVAKNKRVWILLDPSLPNAEADYKKVQLLSSVGYARYHNSEDICNRFLEDQPFEDLDKTLYQDLIEPALVDPPRAAALFYLKSPVNTEASIRLTRTLAKSALPIVTDDPSEVTLQTLAWYAQNTFSASAVIAHLLDDARAAPHVAQNAKYAFVSGLAFGLDKPLLMLAHAPYIPAFDYQDLLRVHSSANECVSAMDPWLSPIEKAYAEDHQRMVEHRRELTAAQALQRIYLGDYTAENEQLDISSYFIPTAPYTEALHSVTSMLYVGRKGTGKTANLYAISEEMLKDRRNHVCILKPVDYDFQGVLDLLGLAFAHAERGYMLESLWKFLVYTQIAISVRDHLANLPAHIPPTPEEQEFLEYIETILPLVSHDFSVRLETAVSDLCGIDVEAPAGAQRARISEVLHQRILAPLRDHLGRVLSRRDRVCVLVDNLDQAWSFKADLPLLSDFLVALINVSHAISDEFARAGATWKPVRLPVVVFLRSDVFSYLMSHVSEPDKISYTRMDWTDPLLLQRVIEERFSHAAHGEIAPPDVWRRFFVQDIQGVPVQEYISTRIIPRPRDIIYMCKASLAHAINRGHTRIEQDDIQQAESDYSQYAYHTLVAEAKSVLPEIEDLLYEFVGSTDIVDSYQFGAFAARATPSSSPQDLIDLLCDSLFLGLETSQDHFEFLYDQAKALVIKTLARRLAETSGRDRYRINTPFHPYLGINA